MLPRLRPARYAASGTALAALLGGTAAQISAQTIRISPDVVVTDTSFQRRPVEPHLAIHPTNPGHLLGAAITAAVAEDSREMLSKTSCTAFVSRDSGRSWREHKFSVPGCLDPWVTITPAGQGLFTAFASERGELMAYHSPDGVTWEDTPVNLGAGHDHPTSVADGSSPSRASWVYVLSSRTIRAEHGRRAAAIFVSRSRDGGKTFDAPVYVRPSDLRLKAEMPVVLSDGTLVVSYVEASESDGTELVRRRAWVVRSTDGGYTFSIPSFVNEACGPPFRLSMLAVDTSSGPFHHRLYFACNLPGESGVILSHSKQSGEKWSPPVKVHSAPVDTTVRRKAMALAVNSRGAVGIAWTDARNGKPHADCYDVYFAASLDGGASFLPEKRVTQSTSCPESKHNGAIGRIFAPSGGDYVGMVSDATGRFLLLWSDARHGPFQLRSTWIEVNGDVRPPK